MFPYDQVHLLGTLGTSPGFPDVGDAVFHHILYERVKITQRTEKMPAACVLCVKEAVL